MMLIQWDTDTMLKKLLIFLNIPFFHFLSFSTCAVTKAWTTSTAWKWRTWCLCTTCCWRCWMPTSCTVPVCLAGLPRRSPQSRRRFLLCLLALEADPQIPGLPAALEVELNPSSQIRIHMQWIITALHKTSPQDCWYVLLEQSSECWILWLWILIFDPLCTISSQLLRL